MSKRCFHWPESTTKIASRCTPLHLAAVCARNKMLIFSILRNRYRRQFEGVSEATRTQYPILSFFYSKIRPLFAKKNFFCVFICIYPRKAVSLRPKIYVGGICFFYVGGFSDILIAFIDALCLTSRNFATFGISSQNQSSSRCLWV